MQVEPRQELATALQVELLLQATKPYLQRVKVIPKHAIIKMDQELHLKHPLQTDLLMGQQKGLLHPLIH